MAVFAASSTTQAHVHTLSLATALSQGNSCCVHKIFLSRRPWVSDYSDILNSRGVGAARYALKCISCFGSAPKVPFRHFKRAVDAGNTKLWFLKSAAKRDLLPRESIGVFGTLNRRMLDYALYKGRKHCIKTINHYYPLPRSIVVAAARERSLESKRDREAADYMNKILDARQ